MELWYFEVFTDNEPTTEYFFVLILAIALLSLLFAACFLYIMCKIC